MMPIAACTLVCRLIVVLETMISVQKESIFIMTGSGLMIYLLACATKQPRLPAATIVRHTDCAGREASFLLYLAVEAERHSMVSFTPLPGRCMPAMTRWFFFT